jgi:phosphate starvation-inducible PhoH-like protein
MDEFNLDPRSASQQFKLVHVDDRILAGQGDVLKWAEEAISPFKVQMSATPGGVKIDGDEVSVTLASRILEQIGAASSETQGLDSSSLKTTMFSAIQNCLRHDLAFRLGGLQHPVRSMSLSQFAFMRSLLSRDKTFVIGIGPAGTGKTHLAVAAGLHELASGHVKSLIITKPHVAMEGEVVTAATRQDIDVDYQFGVFDDILHDLIGHKEIDRLVEQRMLQMMPLGRMRGRTFNEAFVIVDEAQNMTVRKMRMVLTRIGRGSRIVLTGDPTQADLLGDEVSGLGHLLELIQGTDIATVQRFESRQIIRNKIVARLESLYERAGEEAMAA